MGFVYHEHNPWFSTTAGLVEVGSGMQLAGSEYDVFDIPIRQIWRDPEFNCRESVTKDSIVELAGTIDLEGLLFPVVVQPSSEVEVPAGFRYRLICGFRRTEACISLGWDTIPANIRYGLSERQAHMMNLQENLERKDLNILEEARAMDLLFPEYRTDQSISTELQRNIKWVSVRRKLLTLSEFVQKSVASGRLSARDLQAIIAHPQPDELARQLVHASHKRRKSLIIQRGKQRKNKSEVQALITEMLAEGFHPNILRLLGWSIGEVDDEGLAVALSWLRDRKGWLK